MEHILWIPKKINLINLTWKMIEVKPSPETTSTLWKKLRISYYWTWPLTSLIYLIYLYQMLMFHRFLGIFFTGDRCAGRVSFRFQRFATVGAESQHRCLAPFAATFAVHRRWFISRCSLCKKNGYGSIPINTIFRGMTIHLPAILMFTRGIGFWPIPKCGFRYWNGFNRHWSKFSR